MQDMYSNRSSGSQMDSQSGSSMGTDTGSLMDGQMDSQAGAGPMVSSSDVNGTAVYGPTGDHLGSIDHLMIDKQSGHIAYAVMTFGGFLGMGSEEHPLPWKKLSYDTNLAGFVTDVTQEQLAGAPRQTEGWSGDRGYAQESYDYYGVSPYWR